LGLGCRTLILAAVNKTGASRGSAGGHGSSLTVHLVLFAVYLALIFQG
jgi:hypothetical protein